MFTDLEQSEEQLCHVASKQQNHSTQFDTTSFAIELGNNRHDHVLK